ncbi:MAG: hypothetical protein AB2L07_16020 [Thermoanaerobaculaceae bacterium]
MGGSGGSSDFGAIGGGGGDTSASGGRGSQDGRIFNCRTFRATVSLRSPNPAVLEKLKEGQQLPVRLSDDGHAVIVTSGEETAGSVVLPELSDLVDCIKGGTRYEAKVLSVEAGACVVEISCPSR